MKRFPPLAPIAPEDLADASIAQRDVPMPMDKHARDKVRTDVIKLLSATWATRDTTVRKVK